MESWEKLKETKPPLKNGFYNKLNMKNKSSKDHRKVQEVSNTMEKMTLIRYTALTWEQMFYCWQIYLRPSKICA